MLTWKTYVLINDIDKHLDSQGENDNFDFSLIYLAERAKALKDSGADYFRWREA